MCTLGKVRGGQYDIKCQNTVVAQLNRYMHALQQLIIYKYCHRKEQLFKATF